MVQLNLALREINCKVVYFGCGLGGKTTNLEIVHEKAAPDSRGELTSIATESDRTLFFDFMPLDLGTVSGMRVKFQLYTVPGQVYYNSTRKLVLRGADGVIFVADSQRDKLEENIESLENLAECLREQGRDLADMPHVIQFNKRDLPDVMSVEEMKAALVKDGAPCFEAVASKGDGVLETFKALAAMMLEKVKGMSTESAAKPGARTQRMGGEVRTGSQRIATDVHRLQGGIASTPAKATPIAREAARPAPEPPQRKPVAPPSVEVEKPGPSPRPAREAASAGTPVEPKPSETPRPAVPAAELMPPRERPAPAAPPRATPEPAAKKEKPAPVATAIPERVRPSVRRDAEPRGKDKKAPRSRRSAKTTSGLRVAGSGIMITTSARRRKKSSKAGMIVAIVVTIATVGAGAAAAWHFLM